MERRIETRGRGERGHRVRVREVRPADGKEGMGDKNFFGPSFREFALVIGGDKSMAGCGNGPIGTTKPPACTFVKVYIAAVLQGTHTHT